MSILSKIESLLFVAGEEGMTLNELTYVLNVSSSNVYESVVYLKEQYEADEDKGLTILELGDVFILSTKKELASVLKKYAQSSISQSLSQAALESLAIIAYKQPITRVEIEEIRGVQSSGSLQKLQARRLVQEEGRVEGPGRAKLYGTTQYFLDYFGLKTIKELPEIEELENKAEEVIPQDLFFERFKDQFDQISDQ